MNLIIAINEHSRSRLALIDGDVLGQYQPVVSAGRAEIRPQQSGRQGPGGRRVLQAPGLRQHPPSGRSRGSTEFLPSFFCSHKYYPLFEVDTEVVPGCYRVFVRTTSGSNELAVFYWVCQVALSRPSDFIKSKETPELKVVITISDKETR